MVLLTIRKGTGSLFSDHSGKIQKVVEKGDGQSFNIVSMTNANNQKQSKPLNEDNHNEQFHCTVLSSNGSG